MLQLVDGLLSSELWVIPLQTPNVRDSALFYRPASTQVIFEDSLCRR
jgi:hypothetical protein